MKKSILAVLAVCAALVPAQAEEDCRLQLDASMPMQINANGSVVVTASVEGHPVRFLVDTGTSYTILTQSFAKAQGMALESIAQGFAFEIYGGFHINRGVHVHDFELGRIKMEKASFLVAPEGKEFTDADGLLGSDVLSNFDVDFDFAHAKLNLFEPHPCSGKAVYWTQDGSQIVKLAFESSEYNRDLVVPVQLDGHDMHAILDTGASVSVANLEDAMDMFGFKKDSPDLQPVNLKSGEELYRYPFKALAMDGLTVQNPAIFLNPVGQSRFYTSKLLLGMTVLRQLHLFIAYRERMLYITPASAQ